MNWTIDQVFEGLELGYQLIDAKIRRPALTNHCRRLTRRARDLYPTDLDKSQSLLDRALQLVESVLG